MELPEDIFGIEPNTHCIWLAVKQFLAAQRQGTAKTKTRAEANGSSRKLHRQKGTGGSRKGNLRNPLYKGGGAVNGPVPHLYGFKLNRKVKDLAKMSALSMKAAAGKVIVVEDLNLETPKTKVFSDMIGAVTGKARKALYIVPEYNQNVLLSSRNLPGSKTVVLTDINTYDLMNANVLVFTESAINMFHDEVAEVNA